MAQPHVSSPEQPNDENLKEKGRAKKKGENQETRNGNEQTTAGERAQARNRSRRIANGKVFLLIFALGRVGFRCVLCKFYDLFD